MMSDARLLNYMQGGCQAIRQSFVCLVSRIYASKEPDAGITYDAQVRGPATFDH
jgi:hypothetical protein